MRSPITFAVSPADGSGYPDDGLTFAASDIAARQNVLQDAGVHFFTNGVVETPSCRVAWCRDSEANTFAIDRRK